MRSDFWPRPLKADEKSWAKSIHLHSMRWVLSVGSIAGKAEPLLVELLEISQGVLVEGHPDRVAAMNELIKLYDAWGKPQIAEQWRSKLPSKKGTEEQ